ncbi:MAG: DNA polymerase III subunit epsilon [Gammaproteobacteria bacterium]|nr:DNA polymerase III subunit epsilon [Gammaproteobacteria bacterium]
MRQIVLDTETTGLDPKSGHRIIEIGCVELMNRNLTGNHYHQYINPQREVDAGAMAVHGISNEFLADKPTFDEIAQPFFDYIKGAELIIHNAPFDVGFINHEFVLLGQVLPAIDSAGVCTILDTLKMARKRHPGQRNSLDALCKRYGVDNTQRDLHGALLDSEILADVYLAMTGGQVSLSFGDLHNGAAAGEVQVVHQVTPVIKATSAELEAHESLLETVRKESGGHCLWKA